MDTNLKRLWQYFLITYGFSWIVWSPFILDSRGIIEIPSFWLPVFGPIGTFGPFVAAFFLTFWDDGKRGVIDLAKKGINWKFNKIWWIPIILLWPVYASLGAFIGGGFWQRGVTLTIKNHAFLTTMDADTNICAHVLYWGTPG